MRLSDAIALGSLLLKSAPHFRNLGGSGCALGMAEEAIGLSRLREPWIECLQEYQWLNEPVSILPCGCSADPGATFTTAVAHTFNYHVHGRRNWTLDQLIDWVRSVEPAEETPAPNAQVAEPFRSIVNQFSGAK